MKNIIIFSTNTLLISLLTLQPSYSTNVSEEADYYEESQLIKIIEAHIGGENLLLNCKQASTIYQSGKYEYYSNHNSDKITASGITKGVFMGWQIFNYQEYQSVIGIDYNQPTSIKYAGYLLQSQAGAPQEKFNFEYKLASKQVLLENKLYWHTSNYLDLFIMIGVGVSQNKFYGFRTEAKNSSTSTLDFPNNTEIHISYAIGSGVRTMLSENFSLELLYRFSNYGKFTSKPGEIISEKTKLTQKQENISGQQALMSLGYYW